ncbi:atp adenylyltransferase (5-p-4-tetraphosphate phosphorylase ii) [Stylonychia lemnae]|uniref:Atp adenylyltransferase (5-p-4-tetraphosphate phosphorylase ii) n=1 Tax=Stylonychia lemnae TaxID=5949 RepID=A0A078AVZ4_STYLE|nr:atp adenylyltransferase (5-p-4-tetraphosphate phosphorylase ii) [Stylonychia lemnae]|eukprot:CDW85382.1 atp adenylyltransferase (5-p-4-tetraphosphate phosphorylase ii) [Stylonychia lemnae]
MISTATKQFTSKLKELPCQEFLVHLKDAVKTNFKNNPSIQYLKTSENIKKSDQGIDYDLKVIETLNNKPDGTKEDFLSQNEDESKAKKLERKNPFLPPFEDGQFIEEISDTHSLIYNKYSVCEEHVIIVTQEFEPQTSPLTVDDFKAALLTCKALNAFAFFNCGFNSGASIPHKHIQVIPYASLNSQSLPIEQAAVKYLEENKIEGNLFNLPQFTNFQHTFAKVESEVFDSAYESYDAFEEQAIKLENQYWECIEQLGIQANGEEISYNFLMMKNIMLIAPRSKEGYRDEETGITVNVNSLGFAGTFAVKNQNTIISLLLVGILASQLNCQKILKVTREIQKTGLHREMQTNTTILIEKPSELRCHLIFRENITKDLYIYMEEAMELKKFEFYPRKFIDIEKPSSASKHREFLWKVPLHMEKKLYSNWIHNHEVRTDLGDRYILHIQAHIPFHFRYQPARYNQSYTNVSFPNPDVFIDCDQKNIKKFSRSTKGSSKLNMVLDENNSPDFIPADMIPNGKKEELQEITICTLGATFIGFFIIMYSMTQKRFIQNNDIKTD